MEAAHGPHVPSLACGRPRRGEKRVPMVGKTVMLPDALWRKPQLQAREQHTTFNSMIVHRLESEL